MLRQLVQSVSRLSIHNPQSLPFGSLLSTSNSVLNTPFTIQRYIAHNIPVPWRLTDYLQSVTDKEAAKEKQLRPSLKKRPVYTTRPLPRAKTGGRDARGRVVKRSDAGGAKRHYRMVMLDRRPPEGQTEMFEKVYSIKYDPNRSARLALVAYGENKRYIIATQSMQPGDVLKVSKEIPRIAVRPKDGDCYPLGALPIGTLVSSVETVPGEGAKVAMSAGTVGVLVRKIGDRCIVQMPSKREMNIDENCIATVGRVSNIDHNKKVLGKAGANRWRGIRPRSGLWHRKDGRFGRKIKPIKKAKVHNKDDRARVSKTRFQL